MKVPLRQDDVVLLKGAAEFDADELCRAVQPLGFKPFVATRFELVGAEVKQLPIDKGVSHIWQLVRLQEAVLPRTPDLPAIVAVLQRMMARVEPTREFIIVHRFLLQRPRSTDYLKTLVLLLGPRATRVSRLVLITSKEYDSQLLRDLGVRLGALSLGCRVVHRISDSFHDRFWIADREGGLFVGTSLNGVGLRYALVDYMDKGDVCEIVAPLNSEGLL